MSNTEASRTYEAIVEAVIHEVREEFENAGIDEQTLQDLKRNWQIKLSETKVTQFTWDSAYNDPDGMATASLQNNNTLQPLASTEAAATTTTTNPTVKAENSAEPGFVMSSLDGDSAAVTQPTVKEEDNGDSDKVGNHNITAPDTDAIQVLSNDKPNNENTEKTTEIELEIENATVSTGDEVRLQEKKAKRSALLDTDEVGSELDDSDDDYLISEGEDDGPDENLMLCLYDKVTRTKARWKCALKDGVVTINHKDYTFQKAQVEAEWV